MHPSLLNIGFLPGPRDASHGPDLDSDPSKKKERGGSQSIIINYQANSKGCTYMGVS